MGICLSFLSTFGARKKRRSFSLLSWKDSSLCSCDLCVLSMKRRKLMDTNSQSMELSLEQSRHLIIVRDWEGERHAKKKVNPLTEGKDNEATIDNKDLDNMEKGELETLALVGSPDEPPEVVMARERLGNLQVQRQRLDIEKNRLARELGECRAKAAQLEESLPSAIGSEEHREILSLLCKVHELEIENTESQSAILLKDFELRKKDMIIERYEHNRLLCDQIIQQQRRLVLDHAVDIPEDLEESFDLYLQLNEGEMNAGTPTELNPPRLHSVAQLMKIFGETEVDTSQRSDPSATESEQSSSTNDSPREAVSRRLPGRRRRRDADAIINGEEKLFRESAKARKIFSRKNHQDSAPDILEGAATRLDGVARVTARTPTPVKPETRRSRGTETRLVSLSDPCSPVGSPTGDPFKPKYQLPRDSSSPNPHFPGTKAEGAAGLRRYSRVGNKVGLHPRVEVEQTSPGEGVAELVSSRSPAPAANVKNQTQSISLIAAARRRAHNDGRLSISINDLTEIGVPSNRATQNVSSLSFVSSVATHDGVVRLDTGNGDPGHAAPRRDSLLVAPPRFQGISRNPTRNRVPSPEADDRSTIVADAGKAKAARGAPERRRRGVFRNSYDVEGDYSKPWRQNAALKNRAPGKGSKNGGGSKLWFPRDVPEREPQSLLSREAPSSTVPQVNSSSGVAPLTIVRKNRGGILANNATVHSTHSTPAGHVGAPPQQRKRSNPRGNAAINAPAGFTSGRKNAVSDDAVPRMAITGHALKNGDLF